MIPRLTIYQHGLTSFVVCGLCKFLDSSKAKNEIQEKYANHKCGEGEDVLRKREGRSSSVGHAPDTFTAPRSVHTTYTSPKAIPCSAPESTS